MSLSVYHYRRITVAIDADGLINGSLLAKGFGRNPVEYLVLDDTYLAIDRGANALSARPPKVIGVISPEHRVAPYGIDHNTARRTDPTARSHASHQSFQDRHLPPGKIRDFPAASPAGGFRFPAGRGCLVSRRGNGLDKAAPGCSEPQFSFGIVDNCRGRRYVSPVAANSAAGFGDPSNLAHRRPIRLQALFLCSQHRFLVAVRGRPSGLPGSKFPVRQPAHSCHPNRLATIRGSSLIKLGAPPMKHSPARSSSDNQRHADAWKARALAALRADSSLAVRLARYNDAMARARAMESQEVGHA